MVLFVSFLAFCIWQRRRAVHSICHRCFRSFFFGRKRKLGCIVLVHIVRGCCRGKLASSHYSPVVRMIHRFKRKNDLCRGTLYPRVAIVSPSCFCLSGARQCWVWPRNDRRASLHNGMVIVMYKYTSVYVSCLCFPRVWACVR